jgi:hypothetical protein
MHKQRVTQEIGNGWDARVAAVPTLMSSTLILYGLPSFSEHFMWYHLH